MHRITWPGTKATWARVHHQILAATQWDGGTVRVTTSITGRGRDLTGTVQVEDGPGFTLRPGQTLLIDDHRDAGTWRVSAG